MQQNFLLLCRRYKNPLQTKMAALAGVNRSTVKLCFKELQLLIAQNSLQETAREGGEFELDASCFGAKQGCGERKPPRCQQASPPYLAF